MANTKEIKNHIKSVRDTKKITNAMYLIASTKLQKAKREHDLTRPYFNGLKSEIKRIFRRVTNVESKYFYPQTDEVDYKGTYGLLVITADKGLAGAYNQNVIKEAMRLINMHEDVMLFVVGEYGRHYFDAHNIEIEQSFLYTAQNPTIQRAREISDILLNKYNNDEIVKMFVVYTDFSNGITGGEATSTRLLPFHRDEFGSTAHEEEKNPHFEFRPSAKVVLDNMLPGYITGFIYSTLVESFCSEQNARMVAMDSANQNAQKLLDELELKYNYIRQDAITQEITEISSGAKALKRKREKKKGGTI